MSLLIPPCTNDGIQNNNVIKTIITQSVQSEIAKPTVQVTQNVPEVQQVTSKSIAEALKTANEEINPYSIINDQAFKKFAIPIVKAKNEQYMQKNHSVYELESLDLPDKNVLSIYARLRSGRGLTPALYRIGRNLYYLYELIFGSDYAKDYLTVDEYPAITKKVSTVPVGIIQVTRNVFPEGGKYTPEEYDNIDYNIQSEVFYCRYYSDYGTKNTPYMLSLEIMHPLEYDDLPYDKRMKLLDNTELVGKLNQQLERMTDNTVFMFKRAALKPFKLHATTIALSEID